MAKKSMLEREKKRKALINKYSIKRKLLVEQLKKVDSLENIFELNEKIQKIATSSDDECKDEDLISSLTTDF
jgi:small subunit ribosomal protein S14